MSAPPSDTCPKCGAERSTQHAWKKQTKWDKHKSGCKGNKGKTTGQNPNK